jgi:perosamine synthetase
MPIPYGRQTIEDDDVAAVVEALRGDFLTQGPRIEQFEQAVAEACDAPYAVAFSSGTAALHGAALAAQLGAGDELLTSALTFAASANCGAYVGATPVFADIDPTTWNMSAETAGAALTSRTRMVIPVHFTGLPAPIADIRAVVGQDVTIVEDAAHAIGARQPDEPVGACRHSDMAVFSFHPVKTVTSGEGGVVTTRSADLFERLRDARTHGITKDPRRLERTSEGAWYMEQQSLGFNYRITDVQCALGVSQMAKLDRFVTRRNDIAQRYDELLADMDELVLPASPPPDARHGRHLYVIRHRGGSEARRSLYDGLREHSIFAQVHYLPVYLHPWYRDTYGYSPGLCPAAEEYYAGCLSLPCFPTLTDSEQDSVVAAVRDLV